MPTIATPPQTSLREWRGERPALPTESPEQSPSIAMRTRVALRRGALTQRLAEGVDPDASAELSLRARQLTGARERRTLARTLERTIEQARRPALGRFAPMPIRRRAVIDAEQPIQVMTQRLRDSRPVAAEGMALIERLITDGMWSPLYNATAPGALRRLTVLATAALEPDPGQTAGWSQSSS